MLHRSNVGSPDPAHRAPLGSRAPYQPQVPKAACTPCLPLHLLLPCTAVEKGEVTMAEPAEMLIHEGFAAAARLGTLGLDLELIMDVIRRGEVARAEATDYDPVTAGGTDAYRYRVRGLREAYCPKGWEVARPFGLELIVAPDGARSILTRGGDHNVGLAKANPQPKGEIGTGTSAALEGTPLLFDPRWVQVQGATRPEHETWMLLVYASATSIRSELSLGTEIEDGRVARWFERIILPELDPNDLTPKRYDAPDAGEDAFDISVTRKKPA